MASALASSERLLSRPWAPVDIGESRFLCKSWFGQTQYHVLLLDSDSDSDCLWEEHMEAAEIQSRAQELNRRLRASIESFFSHLVAVVTPSLTGSERGLTGSGSDHVTVQRLDGHMTLRLKSELAGLPFYWEFHCRPAPVTMACVQLVRPLLVMSGALQRQTELLFELLQRKDAEIQDYRENGAQLTRERLQTEPFEEEAFREAFMTKTFPSLLDEHEARLTLDTDLQGLYYAIVSRQNANKRKRRNSEELRPRQEAEEAATPTDDHRSGDGAASGQTEAETTENAKTQPPEAKKTTLPTVQQTVSSYPGAAERAAPKPKKKKTGLFR